MKYLYDVCSDYSLCNEVSEKGRKESKTRAYKWIQGNDVLFGYHIKSNELHYLKSDDSELSGEYVK